MLRETEIKLLRAALYLSLIAIIATVAFLVAAAFITSPNYLNVCSAWCLGTVVVCGMSSLVLLAVALFCDIIDDGRASK